MASHPSSSSSSFYHPQNRRVWRPASAATDAATAGNDDTVVSRQAPQRGSRWSRKRDSPGAGAGSHGEDAAVNQAKAVWYFGFGANINPWKLREKRRIIPAEEVPGRLPGYRLLFNHKGGMGNVEPLQGTMPQGPDAVHGILLRLSEADFERLRQMEHEYEVKEVEVEAYDKRKIVARAFVTPPDFKLKSSLPPTERYLNLIRDGSREMKLDESYQAWLQSLSCVKGTRGPEYYDILANGSGKGKGKEKGKANDKGKGKGKSDVIANSAVPSGRLRLQELSSFGSPGTLIDIGANLGKCSQPDLAQQLVRAAAANVHYIILTGCSIKGSQTARHIASDWSDADVEEAGKILGAAATTEIGRFAAANTIFRMPRLGFTAGVHPHDAKTCNATTLQTMRELATDPKCVAIGECGLDYDRMFSPREVQLEWCRKQVELAVELQLPLFLHERDRDRSKGPPIGSHPDLLRILEQSKVNPRKVCVHCFTGEEDVLEAYVSRGYLIGLTGFVGLRKRGDHVRRMLSSGKLPLSQLMLETDCPFMMPDKDYLPTEINIQGRTNEPCAMPGVCNAAAECLNLPAEKVAEVTTANALNFFSRLK